MSNFVKEFTQQKEKLKDLAKNLYEEGFLTKENIQKVNEILNNEKIKIAIIGQMKYGKSTFINSLIFNKEFLPTSSTPMTAALSKIEYGDKDEYKVEFFTHEEFEEMEKIEDEIFQETIAKAKSLGRELYRLLSTTKNVSPEEFEEYVGADGKYTPIVKMLTIKTPNDILKEATIVDTPGFNDPVKSRDEIAFKFIEEADFIILFLYAGRPFDNTDKKIIIDKLQNAPLGKLIVVVNKADILLEEHGTFERVRKYVEEKYKTAVNEGIASPNLREMLLSADIIPISSLMSLLGKMDIKEIEQDENLKWYYDKFKKEFRNISQKDLLELSNIKELEKSIKDGIEKEKNKILIDKVKQHIITPLRLKLSELQTQKLNLEQDLENLENFDDIEDKKKIIDKFMNEEFDEIISTYKVLESISKMSDDFKQQILNEIDEIEKKGGYVSAIESGFLHKKIISYFTEQQKRLENGEIKVVGYNIYQSDRKLPDIDVFRYPEGVEEKQKKKLKELKAKRDNKKVEKALNALKDACKRKENIIPYCIECAKARCTEGEMFKVFKDAYGLWNPNKYW